MRRIACGFIVGVSTLLVTNSELQAQQLIEPVPADQRNVLQQPRSVDTAQNIETLSPPVFSSGDLPVSISGDNDILPLANEGTMALPPVSAQGCGCSRRPEMQCPGPDFCGCSPRIYYGTNPCDDDPVLPLYPSIQDPLTRHWYEAALRMILRKKTIAETIK